MNIVLLYCFILRSFLLNYLQFVLNTLRPRQNAGFIAIREMSGRNKISQGQGIVMEFYKVSGKFWHLAKLMKNVMEFHIMSGKINILDSMTL